MDIDNWYELVDWSAYQSESKVLRLIDDIDLEAEYHGDDRRIFRLEDFFVYDETNTRLLPLDFGRLDNLSIAGKAIPIFPDNNADDTDAEDESGAFESRIRLSAIQRMEYTYLDVSAASYDGVYVLTSFAWYLLQKPANCYLHLYKEPYRQFRLVLTVLRRAYEVPEEKLSKFVTRFRRLSGRIDRKYTKALEWGYPELRPTDLQESSSTIVNNINYFINYLKLELENTADNVYRNNLIDVHTRLTQSRIVEKVLKGHLATIRRRDDDQSTLPSSPLHPSRETITIEDSDDEDIQDRQPGSRAKPGRRTCVTPVVERTARAVFSHPLNLIGERLRDVSWRDSRCRGTAVAGDVELKRGQCIMVPAGIDELMPHEDWVFNHAKTASVNEAANEHWFAQVIATTQDGKRLHVRWFDHSSKTTLLGGLERPMELFLTQRCDYVYRHHVKRIVDVKWFGPDQELPDYEQNYYFRFIRELDGSFTWANPEDIQLDPASPTTCGVCDKAATSGIKYGSGALCINSIDLHKGDFIVTQPMATVPWFDPGVLDATHRGTTPGQIFQVISALRSEQYGREYLVGVILCPLERVDTLRTQRLVSANHSHCPGRPKHDERRLCLMDEWTSQLDLEDLKRYPIRKCFVRHPDMFDGTEAMNKWLADDPTHFIVDVRALPSPPANIAGNRGLIGRPAVSITSLSLESFRELARPCRKCKGDPSGTRITKMRTLDLFCGAGGLTQGLVESGICEPTFAVDHDGAALETYKENFPKATTIHQDVNIALSETFIAALNEHDRAPFSEDADDPEPLPGRHDVDFICGGPPCQSFSGANRFKKDNDPRTTMIVATMSAVGHYLPNYFLIENVPNALTSKILGPAPRAGSTDSADSTQSPPNYIEQGVLRFIARVSLDLGYAFRVGILQAAEYGAPQLRRRAFIIGARHGYTLPDFPLATHCVPHPETGLRLPSGTYIDPIRGKSGNAIHLQTTMWDAIGDLAPFEWVNPHVVIRQTEDARTEERYRRTRLHIPAYVAVHEDRQPVGIGAHGAVPYREENPFTTYQQEARGQEVMVSEHYTSSFRSGVFVERVVSIPISARADHRSLPEVLRKDDFLSNIFGSGGTSGYYRGAFGRYDKKALFATILTSLRPAKKNGFCIHPEQKRMLTMRELARAQGFPDHFRFHGTVEQVNRQIGNAVVVQVARALGIEIKKAMVKDGTL